MANSKFEYVRNFEREEYLLPNTWIVVRIDGKGFHKLSNYYGFTKPNDARALNLMNSAAQHTLRTLPDILFGYGHSDEYSFVFHKSTALFERRSAKIASTVVSVFTAAYVHLWPEHFSQIESSTTDDDSLSTDPSKSQKVKLDLNHLPTFDSRTVSYPSIRNLRDYLSWRQADCHINNLYNTTFWALVQQGGMSNTEAEEFLKGTLSSDKNEILWSRFGVNYNNEAEMFRKGSSVFREYELVSVEVSEDANHIANLAYEDDDGQEQVLTNTQKEKLKKTRQKAQVMVSHTDIIKDAFWLQRPWLLSGKPGKLLSAASMP